MRTRFLDSRDVAKLVRSQEVVRFMQTIATYIEQDFLRWPEFEKSPRMASHSPLGVIELMPVSDKDLYAFKYVNGHPLNPAHGLQTVMAFGVLAQVSTGFPLLLSEMTLMTAVRTAATCALAAKAMARPDSRVMALIGNGAQSEFQALAFLALLGIRQLRAYDIDASATRRMMANLSQVPGLEIVVASSVADAVKGADIITTATADKRRAAVLKRSMVAPGTHVNAVGGDCPGKTELHAGVLRDARVVVEFAEQSRHEGEVQQMEPAFPVYELHRVLAGEEAGRRSPDEVTVFDSVGFALEDFSALRCLHDMATAHEVGRWLDLVPRMEDPRNLFGLLESAVSLPQAEA